MTKVWVEGNEHSYVKMFQSYGYTTVTGLEEADLICFTGGADVNPEMYGHAKHRTTMFNKGRDSYCKEVFAVAWGNNKPMVGICRGGQFLNVMAGGTMYQHVTNHGIWGTHEAIEVATGDVYQVSSTHHQMMKPSNVGKVLVVAQEESERIIYDVKKDKFVKDVSMSDIEVIYYEHTNSLCFQPHPEYFDKGHECPELFFKLLSEYLEV